MRLICSVVLTLGLASCSISSSVGPEPPDAEPSHQEPPGFPQTADPPAAHVSAPIPPIEPVPSEPQLAYQRMETNAFVHFGPNTFTGDEWGSGQASPAVFAPSALDAGQWAEVFRDAGFQGAVLVAKHHDGFLLWPSAYSGYSVAQSPWRGGRGDLAREATDALRAAGLEVGFYLSPWDRNHPDYGTPAYNDYVSATLRELIDGYGEPFEIWLDGAYGPEVTREQLDAYDWPRWLGEIRRWAPGAVIALDQDVFWPGNENGVGLEENWSVRSDFRRWAPYECDTTIRTQTHWFWNPADAPRTLDDLVDTYFKSVGRACTLLLNVPPDRRGLISDEDAGRLREWRAALDGIFARDLALGATATASGVRSGDPGWGAGAAVDGDADSFWSTDEPTGWLEVDLGTPQRVDVVELAEPIRYGQRIASFHVDAWDGAGWQRVVDGTTVNYKRLLRIVPTTAQRWRVVVEDARAAPALSQLGLYAAPDWAGAWADRLD